MKNKTEVNLKVDKGAVKMCGILERGRNLRRFLFGVVVVICVFMPIAIGIGSWIAKH